MSRYRKHILAAVFVLMALCVAGDWLLGRGLLSPFEPRRARTARLQKQIRTKKEELTRIRKAAKQLDLWHRQSLPSNLEVARSFYQGWLIELIDHVGWTNPTVDSGEPVNHRDLYYVLTFTVRGRGNLEQLTTFLFEFYRAGHLHQIHTLDISPTPRKGLLDLAVTIEAVALSDLKDKDRLNTEPADRLVSDRLADYTGIVRRNLFGVGAGGGASSVRLTAVTSVGGQPQAWFTFDNRAEIVQLVEGDALDTGAHRARVLEIYAQDVILDIDGQHWLMSIGESLSQASALPPGS